MSFNRIYGLFLRHFYLIKSSLPRILDLIYWPTIQIILWGFISLFFSIDFTNKSLSGNSERFLMNNSKLLFGLKYSYAGSYLKLYIWTGLPYFTFFAFGHLIFTEDIIKKSIIVPISLIITNIILNFSLFIIISN